MIMTKRSAPKAIPNYEEKLDYLSRLYDENCVIAAALGKVAGITDLHHALIHNTEVNRHRFPLLVHSIINLMPVNNDHHLKNPSFGRISEHQADILERMLEQQPDVARFVNTLSWEE